MQLFIRLRHTFDICCFPSAQSNFTQTKQDFSNTVVRVDSAEGLRIFCGPADHRLEYLLRMVDSQVSIW